MGGRGWVPGHRLGEECPTLSTHMHGTITFHPASLAHTQPLHMAFDYIPQNYLNRAVKEYTNV